MSVVQFSGDWALNDKRFARLSEQETDEVMLAGAEVVYNVSQELVPVDTGNLKSTGAIDRQEISVGYGADYADDVEFGTSRMSAQPYLRPAVDEHQSQITEAMQHKLDEVRP